MINATTITKGGTYVGFCLMESFLSTRAKAPGSRDSKNGFLGFRCVYPIDHELVKGYRWSRGCSWARPNPWIFTCEEYMEGYICSSYGDGGLRCIYEVPKTN